MSRAGAKTGGKDKQAKPALVVPQHPASPDIVPGRFSENDWFLMLERDSVVDFVLDYIEEILAFTMHSIHKLSISKQMVPFTVYQALTEVMHIVEWKFLHRDDGEISMAESGWVQDEEPNAAVLDSWAQGAVPRTEVITSYLVEDDPDISSKAPRKAQKEAKEVDTEVMDTSGKGPDTGPGQEKKGIMTKKKAKPKGIVPKKKHKVSAVFQVTPTEELLAKELEKAEVAESVPSFASVLMAPRVSLYQGSYKAEGSNMKFDDKGSVVSVKKLDADTLPSHRVWVKFHLVDPIEEMEKAGHSSLHHSITQPHHQHQHRKSTNLESLTAVKFLTKTRKFTPLEPPPSVWENIKISPGVSISECGRSKKFTGKISRAERALNLHLKSLQPISLALRDKPSVSVTDLLDLNSPVIRSLDDSKPLPPISRVASKEGERTDEKTYKETCKKTDFFPMRVTD